MAGAIRANRAWSEEQAAYVEKQWRAGWSAGKIADGLGAIFSRNAVISKVHRMGLTKRDQSARPFQTLNKAALLSSQLRRATSRTHPPVGLKGTVARDAFYSFKPHFKVAAGLKDIPALPCDPPMEERVTLVQLVEISCRWPLGVPGNADFRFCGRVKVAGSSYCKGHEEAAHPNAYHAENIPLPWEEK